MAKNQTLRALEIYCELRESSSKTVKIDHFEVERLVVNDLLEKLKMQIQDNNEYWINHLKAVLLYYLTEEELEKKLTVGVFTY